MAVALMTLVTETTSAEIANRIPYIPKSQLPKNSQWVSLDPGVEFLPNTDANLPPLFPRRLDEAVEVEAESNSQYSMQPFVEGVSDYDAYQQAWRLLGFVIDCEATYSDDDQSHDSNDNEMSGEGCQRYVLWAAVRALYRIFCA